MRVVLPDHAAAGLRRVAPLAAVGATLGLLLLNIALFGEFVRCGILIPLGMILVFSVGAQLGGRASWLGLGLIWAFFLSICLFDSSEGAPLDAMLFLVPVSALVWGAGTCCARAARLPRRSRRARPSCRKPATGVPGSRSRPIGAGVQRAGRAPAAAPRRARGHGRGRQRDHRSRRRGRRAPRDRGREPRDARPDARGRRRAARRFRESAGARPADAHAPRGAAPARAGSDARPIVEGSPRALPAGVELAAYRIVEQLLDTLEDVPVDVTVRFGDDALELAVSGPARRPNSAAIKRAQERVQLYSGTLRSTMQGGRAESVASLPMLAGA